MSKRTVKPLPRIYNRTEWEWRHGSHNHAVKLDSGHDGWETVCGMKLTRWSDIHHQASAKPSVGFCKRCLEKTQSTLAIIPNQDVRKCFEVALK